MAVIKFAPLNIPLERRLQTLAAAYYVFFFLIAPPLSIFIAVYLLLTSFWWITALYFIWFVYDFRTPERGARPLSFIRNGINWRYLADYFPIKLVKTAELPPQHNYIFGSHPHGIMSIGAYTSFCTNGTGFWDAFPGLKTYLAALNGQFWFPFRRECLLTSGMIACSRSSITHVLNNSNGGVGVAIVLGGAEEALDAHSDCYDLLLMRRKGFIALALETGHVVFRRYAGFSPPIFCGRGMFNYTFGILPFRTPIHTVVGTPIAVEKKLNPTQEDVDRLHEVYREELRKLFDEHKQKFGIDKNVQLNFY
ncbi:unnamed protein product [Anisakis simplex]|uniref:Acyltransferase n=1 Tax=Anisakis simplex TaxID=6269 RepID=A0A0M3K9S4_ANISI|nr:unnamed protein product [Anisakis simplex]